MKSTPYFWNFKTRKIVIYLKEKKKLIKFVIKIGQELSIIRNHWKEEEFKKCKRALIYLNIIMHCRRQSECRWRLWKRGSAKTCWSRRQLECVEWNECIRTTRGTFMQSKRIHIWNSMRRNLLWYQQLTRREFCYRIWTLGFWSLRNQILWYLIDRYIIELRNYYKLVKFYAYNN